MYILCNYNFFFNINTYYIKNNNSHSLYIYPIYLIYLSMFTFISIDTLSELEYSHKLSPENFELKPLLKILYLKGRKLYNTYKFSTT